MSAGCIDVRALRKALGAFATGVTIVTTEAPDGTPRGFTANSFTSVSLDPPLVLVCIARAAGSAATFTAARHFAISILSEEQRATSALFASPVADRFVATPWRRGHSGSPLIAGAAAWFDCAMHETVDAGDHVILIGRVLAFDHAEEAVPLGYCRGAYVRFGLSQEVTAAAGQACVGAILERDEAVLLLENPDGSLGLPVGTRLEPADDPTSLRGRLRALGLHARLDFLFAVFEAPSGGPVCIHYRGALTGSDLPASGALWPLGAMPWQRLRDPAVASMLRRYIRERSEDTFGIYVGDADQGEVQALAPPLPTPA